MKTLQTFMPGHLKTLQKFRLGPFFTGMICNLQNLRFSRGWVFAIYKIHKIYKIYKIHKIYKIYKIYVFLRGWVFAIYKIYKIYKIYAFLRGFYAFFTGMICNL